MVGEPKLVGERKNHFQIRFGQGDVTLKGICWNLAARAAELKPGAPCSVVFTPSINEWNGNRSVQLEVKDFRVHDRQDSLHARPA